MADFVGPDPSMPIIRSRVHGEQMDRFQLLGDGTVLKGDGSGSLSVESGALNAIDQGADPTFVRECAAVVFNALTRLKDAGGGVLTFPAGHYKLNAYQGSAPVAGGGNPRSILYLDGFGNIEIELQAGAVLESTLSSTAASANIFEFHGGSPVIRGPGKIVGANALLQDSTNANVRPAAIRFTGCTAPIVQGVEITGFGYSGIYITAGTTHALIADNYIHDQGGHGVTEDDFPATGTYVSTPPSGNHITRNKLVRLNGAGPGAFGIVLDSPGARTWTKADHNHIDTVSLAGVKCNCASARVEHNDILNTTWDGIYYQALLPDAGSAIRFNQIHNCGQSLRGDTGDYSSGIWLEANSAHAGTVECIGNKITSSGKHGIYALGLSDSSVERNEINGTANGGHGIYGYYDTPGRDGTRYSHNRIRNTAGDGIRLAPSGTGVGQSTGIRVDGNSLRLIGLTAINWAASAVNQFVGVSCSFNTIQTYALNGTGDGINFDVTRGAMEGNTIESGTSGTLRNYVRTTGLASRVFWVGRFPSGNQVAGINDQSGQMFSLLYDANGFAMGKSSSAGNQPGAAVFPIDAGSATIRAGRSLVNGRATQTLAANGAVTIDSTLGNYQDITLSANATSSSISTIAGYIGMEMTIAWRQDGPGGRTYSWPANCKFAGGAAPTATTASGKIDAVTFRYDGTNWIEVSRAVAVG